MAYNKEKIFKYCDIVKRMIKKNIFYCCDKFTNFILSILIKLGLYKKRRRAFFVVVNKKYLFALGTLLVNLKSLDIKYDTMIVYHDSDIGKSDINKFSFENRCFFVRYTLLDFKKEFGLSDKSINKNFLKKYSHLSYIKFFILKYLVSFETIIFLDLDILVTQNIEELFSLDCNIAWRNGDNFKKKFYRRDRYGQKILNKYAITNTTPTPNGGLVILNDNFNFISALRDAKEFLVENIFYFTSGLDELIFAYICKE